MTENISIEIDKVVKRYGSVTALHDISFDIKDNEFFTLLGPSGCGKTTLLRCIAGFEAVSEGNIRLNGEDLLGLKAHQRPINTVFQQYALFPQMTVEENVMFGLLRSKWSKPEARQRAADVLKLVQLEEFAKRKSTQLSGGQQQRVALARALAPRPKVLLLDEPLSALDLKLRQSVRLQLKEIQRDTGIAFVFVTHDQEEALTMSDRIAVMSNGYVQQIGTPKEIYEAPTNHFVAEFIGETNLLDVDIQSVSVDTAEVTLANGRILTCPSSSNTKLGKGHLSVRPERAVICPLDQGDLQGVVKSQMYLGTDTQIQIESTHGEVLALRMQNSTSLMLPEIGDNVGVKLEAGTSCLLTD